MELALSKSDLDAYLGEVFPQVWSDFALEEIGPESVRIRLNVEGRHLRPGDTVSGPSIFALADVAVYAMVLARIGRKALAVTTNASVDFMRKPVAGADIVAEGRLLKLGRVLAVGHVTIFSVGDSRPVAQANMTYSIPPER